mmetsp:Transcript_10217/g.16466  ORF Transcript_10217/g.16466 Transcript_10217/m.16466 type:complete len:98 (-) Transcript_10217:654-947(-)
MGFLHLFIVNKSGGLILHRPLGPNAPRIGTNEWLRIGSTFHSLHAIAAEAGPTKLPGNKNSCEFRRRFLFFFFPLPSWQCVDSSSYSLLFCGFLLLV